LVQEGKLAAGLGVGDLAALQGSEAQGGNRAGRLGADDGQYGVAGGPFAFAQPGQCQPANPPAAIEPAGLAQVAATMVTSVKKCRLTPIF